MVASSAARSWPTMTRSWPPLGPACSPRSADRVGLEPPGNAIDFVDRGGSRLVAVREAAGQGGNLTSTSEAPRADTEGLEVLLERSSP